MVHMQHRKMTTINKHQKRESIMRYQMSNLIARMLNLMQIHKSYLKMHKTSQQLP